ncbi:hypothetical protein GCM10023089_32980 [Quisquiliibacterium transsilvanicum]
MTDRLPPSDVGRIANQKREFPVQQPFIEVDVHAFLGAPRQRDRQGDHRRSGDIPAVGPTQQRVPHPVADPAFCDEAEALPSSPIRISDGPLPAQQDLALTETIEEFGQGA